MSDASDHCTCAGYFDPFDPYYQCSFCEQQQEDAEAGEVCRIFLLERPATKTAPAIPAGYYGPVAGVSMNEPIYCRVSKAEAWTYEPDEAVRQVLNLRDKGYPARCEPPVTRTF